VKLALLVLVAIAGAADAAVTRYAVLIGSNAGAHGEVELRYAEDDARKLANVLTSLGGFPTENVVVLDGKTSEEARRALITINDRIRTGAPADTMLLVYYSGHASADELHLGTTSLAVAQLESLVRGSSATIRILILDSCRSGALTRVKGGSVGPPVAISLDDKLAGEGVVFLTASSANEDAQESDEIRGSFFTHYLVSGLLGAADENGDGAVSLEEAYRSAYDGVLRASSQTLTLQHPTFHFDVRGQGDLVLTRLAEDRSRRARVAFPPHRTYLVFRGGRDGPVVAEVSTFDKNRQISIEAGRYFVRARDSDYALEGPLEVATGDDRTVDDSSLKRIEYARLVHKGMARGGVWGVRAGYADHTAIASGDSACQGGFVGVAYDVSTWSVEARLAACRDGFSNTNIVATNTEYDAEVRFGRPWDLDRIAVVPAIVLGTGVIDQTFQTRGVAPARRNVVDHIGVALMLVGDLGRGFHVVGDVAGETYAYSRNIDATHAELTSAFVVRVGVGIGKYF
jgi:hypothetical protein